VIVGELSVTVIFVNVAGTDPITRANRAKTASMVFVSNPAEDDRSVQRCAVKRSRHGPSDEVEVFGDPCVSEHDPHKLSRRMRRRVL
jgi:hypothetical protein